MLTIVSSIPIWVLSPALGLQKAELALTVLVAGLVAGAFSGYALQTRWTQGIAPDVASGTGFSVAFGAVAGALSGLLLGRAIRVARVVVLGFGLG